MSTWYVDPAGTQHKLNLTCHSKTLTLLQPQGPQYYPEPQAGLRSTVEAKKLETLWPRSLRVMYRVQLYGVYCKRVVRCPYRLRQTRNPWSPKCKRPQFQVGLNIDA